MSIVRPAINLDFARSQMLGPRCALTRASKGAFFDVGGVWREAPINGRRIAFDPTTGACLGVLLEPARNNMLRNPRGEGVSAPSTAPTYWSVVNVPSGVTATLAPFSEGILTGMDLTLSGTGSGVLQVHFEGTNTITATAGEALQASVFVSLVSGSLANLALTFSIRQGTSSGSLVGESVATTITPIAAPIGTQRVTNALASALAGTECAMPRVLATIDGAVSATLRFAWPQLEPGLFASTPVLPAVGAPGETTRAVETGAITLADFGLPTGLQQGTVLVGGRTPAGIDTSAQYLFSMLGTGENSLVVSYNASNYPALDMLSGGEWQANITSSANIARGTDFLLAATFASNDCALVVNGTLAATDTSAVPPIDLYMIRMSAVTTGKGWGGTIARIAFWPQRIDNATLQALTA